MKTTSPWSVATSALALALTVLLLSAVLVSTGHDPIDVWFALLDRAGGRASGREDVLVRLTPLLITGLGVLIAVRAGVWNIGIDGQVLVGAFCAALAGAAVVDAGRLAVLVCGLLAGLIGGAAWAVVPAILRARLGLSDVVTSVMFNYLAFFATAWLVKGPARDIDVVSPQTTSIPRELRLPQMFDSRVHAGLLIAVALLAVVAVVLERNRWGFVLTVVGKSPAAARHGRMPVAAVLIVAFVLSGAFAGLAGANDVLSTKGTFQAEWNPQYGLSSFALVFLARRDWRGLPFAAVLLGVLAYGQDVLPRAADIAPAFFTLFEGLLLISLIALPRFIQDLREPRMAQGGAS